MTTTKTFIRYILLAAFLVVLVGFLSILSSKIVFAAPGSITFNSGTVTLQTDADGNSIANIGDTIRVTANITNTDGNGADPNETTVTADLSAFGCGAAVAMDVTDGLEGNTAEAWGPVDCVVTAGSTDVGTGTQTVDITYSDGDDGSASSATSTLTEAFDNIAPTISVAGTVTLTTDVGGDGVASIGDTITYAVGTPGSADGDSWTVDLSAYGLSSTAVPAAYVIIADNDDGAFAATETITDNAGNSATGAATISGFTNIDNVAPTIGTPGTVALTIDVGGDGIASIGDTITYAAGTPGSADGDSWTVDLSAYGLSATAVPAAYVLVADNDEAAFAANETVTDNGGNSASGAATITGAFSIDNLAPAGLTALSLGSSTTTTQALSWTAVTETNFDHYEIWYGSNQSNVQGRTASEWDNSDDALLATRTTTSTTITGLSAGTTYFFKIWAIDTALNEETVSDVSSTTTSNGGAVMVISTAPPAAPEGGFTIAINDDVLTTASREVSLSFTVGPDVSRMAISNSSGFEGAIQETYASPKTWMLSDGDGEKTVYVKFYNGNGVATDVVSDSITLAVIAGLEPQPEADEPLAQTLEFLEVTPAASEVEAAEFTQFLAPDSVGDEVRNLQEVLANQGFNPGFADGIFGSRTCEAVKAFQSSEGLLADCKVGLNTRAALNTLGIAVSATTGVAGEFTQFLKFGISNDEVLQLQQFLNTHGYLLAESGPGSPGSETNFFGSLTETAVRAFQSANNLLSDGIIGPNTRAALNSLLNQ